MELLLPALPEGGDGSPWHHGRAMPAARDRLDASSLTPRERRVLESFVVRLEAELGDDLRSVWLFGSRARGEPIANEESDVDVLVIARGASRALDRRVQDLLYDVAEGSSWIWFSILVRDPNWLAGRREIGSFFVQEIDRDKLVLAGEP